jgi:hypothetical protein
VSAGHGRRLRSLARPSGKRSGGEGDAFNANVREANRRRLAEMAPAIAMVEFAQALAGTVLQPAEEKNVPAEPEPTPAEPPPPAPVKRRPDQHTEVTWDEAMRAERVGLPDLKSDPPPRPEAGFEPWDPIIPSYAWETEE